MSALSIEAKRTDEIDVTEPQRVFASQVSLFFRTDYNDISCICEVIVAVESLWGKLKSTWI